jgi:hypothetical protein
MGMDTSETFKSPRSQPDPLQIRDPDPSVITHDDVGNLTAAGYEQGNLPLYFK